MENIVACCAGLDIHKKSVEACVRRMEPTGRIAPRDAPLGNDDRRHPGDGRLDGGALKRGTTYADLGGAFFDQLEPQRE